MDAEQKKLLVGRYVEIRATAKAAGRGETAEEAEELKKLETELGMTADAIYAAFAGTYPSP